MSGDTLSVVQELAKDLSHIDIDNAVSLVDKFGFYGAARILGYEVSHYNNLLLAGRLAIYDLRSKCPGTLLEYSHIAEHRLNKDTFSFIQTHHAALQAAIDRNSFRDYDHDWFSANTMITMYSTRLSFDSDPIETPQYTWMRVAIQIYFNESVERVIQAYEELSIGWYTPATPTILNAGIKKPQLASCFLISLDDNLDSIFGKGLTYGAKISAAGGGLGYDISNIRHSEIDGSGVSSGVIPMLRVYDAMVNYVDQRGKRKGAGTFFLRPHHLDFPDFIDISRKVGDQYSRAHNINTCVWTSWIFWERIRTGGKWTMFCPAKTPQLNNVYGEEFTRLYIEAENDPHLKKYSKTMDARVLYDKILSVQRESGMPYIMNGDAANIKSNHRHLGYIRSSNLCLEVIEYTDSETSAVCNLHSLSLRMYAKKKMTGDMTECVDFSMLGRMTRQAVDNLNKVIDNNWYPLDKKEGPGQAAEPGPLNKSNKCHRPVGLGVAGLAEMLYILDLPFEDPRTNAVNKALFGCMYWNALVESIQLAILHGSYDSFKGSPFSEGKLQFDLWREEFEILGENPCRKREDDEPVDPSVWGQLSAELFDKNGEVIDTVQPSWDDVKRCLVAYGSRNSLLLALMPTASTAQIRRNCESVEAHQNNMYSRKVLTCSYPVLNRYLISDLEELGLWNSSTVEYLKVNNGSLKDFHRYVTENSRAFSFNGDSERLAFLEKKYKTMWEIPQKVFMNLAAERARYIDQSASTNVYLKDCNNDKLRACHMYASNLGLKTIMYYLRQKGGDTIKFSADPSMIEYIRSVAVDADAEKDKKKIVCTDEVCHACT